jgi:hypothetical protein
MLVMHVLHARLQLAQLLLLHHLKERAKHVP